MTDLIIKYDHGQMLIHLEEFDDTMRDRTFFEKLLSEVFS